MKLQLLDRHPKYNAEIENAIAQWEAEFPITVLFYSVWGSSVSGLANKTSDVDVLTFYQPRESLSAAQRQELNFPTHHDASAQPLNGIDVGGDYVDVSLLKHYMRDYDDIAHNSPELICHSALHHDRFDFGILPGKNSPQIASLLTDAVYYGGGSVIDRTQYIRNHFSELYPQFLIYDFLKRRFVSAHGRLTHYLTEPGQCRVRSYLQTVLEVLTMQAVLSEKRLPSAYFPDLLGELTDADTLNSVKSLMEMNANSQLNKEKLLIDPIPPLNAWIAERLEKLRSELLRIFAEERYSLFDLSLSETG